VRESSLRSAPTEHLIEKFDLQRMQNYSAFCSTKHTARRNLVSRQWHGVIGKRERRILTSQKIDLAANRKPSVACECCRSVTLLNVRNGSEKG
jgi:hypothetical protein